MSVKRKHDKNWILTENDINNIKTYRFTYFSDVVLLHLGMHRDDLLILCYYEARFNFNSIIMLCYCVHSSHNPHSLFHMSLNKYVIKDSLTRPVAHFDIYWTQKVHKIILICVPYNEIHFHLSATALHILLALQYTKCKHMFV